MVLTDTFVRTVRPVKETGDKYSDGDGMHLLVTPSGKYWRLDYRFLTAAKRAAITQEKVGAWLRHDVFPYIGALPITSIRARDVLLTVQRMETRGAVDSAHRVALRTMNRSTD